MGPALLHGIKFEPVATQIYEKRNNVEVIEFGCLPHPYIPYFGASPDGICGFNSKNKNYVCFPVILTFFLQFKSSYLVANLFSLPQLNFFQVWPLSGPVQGGTNVTLTGSNLGTRWEDVQHGVVVADAKCLPYRNLYLPSKR